MKRYQMTAIPPEDPFPVMHQIGYGASYLISNTTVFGSEYENAKVSFSGWSGRTEPLVLTANNNTLKDITLTAGNQMIHVENLQLQRPTHDRKGKVFLFAVFTDIDGQGLRPFNGSIAEWTLCGPLG